MAQPNNRSVIETLTDKLSPERLRVSPMFHAILAYLVNAKGWTKPGIVSMGQLSDGILMAGTTEDPFMNCVLGDAGDLDRNLEGVAKAVKLTAREKKLLLQLRTTRIQRF